MTLSIIPLGTNGFIPSYGRQTMSFLVRSDDDALLLDAGTGIARLLEPEFAALLEPYSRLNVILTHYHLDHTIGMSYLPMIWQRGLLRIYAAAAPFVEADPIEALGRILGPPLTTLPLQSFPTEVEVIPLTETRLEIGSLKIVLRAQEHPGGSTGVRIGDALAYITDTIVDEGTIDFVRGVDLLMHNVWFSEAEVDLQEGLRAASSYPSGVARIAESANVERLMPIHHHPRRSDAELRQLGSELQGFGSTRVIVPEEGAVYNLRS